MKRILTGMFVVALMMVLTTGANAGTLSIDGGTAGFIPGGVPTSNIFLSPGGLFDPMTTIQGFYGSTIDYTVLGVGSITIDFFGGEAGFHNQFLYSTDGGATYAMPNALFDHVGSPTSTVVSPNLSSPLASRTFALGSGLGLLLNFEYSVNGDVDTDGFSTGGPRNGVDPLNTLGSPANYFVACDPLLPKDAIVPTTCDSIWVFLDDNGANNDDNHDDYLVRITVTDTPPSVPEPTSFALLGSGLLGLGIVARRLRK